MAQAVTTAGATVRRAEAAKRPRTGQTILRVLFYAIVVLILLYALIPFYWAVRSSLTPSADLFRTPVQYIPTHPTLENYRGVLSTSLFRQALLNSAIVSISVTLLALIIGSFASYAMGRFRFKGRTPVLYLILSMTMFPQIAVLGSLFQLVNTLRLFNQLPALIVTYMLFTLPFTVWTLTNFFRGMPGELEEAAYVDGATPFQTFYKVLLPLAGPGLVTTGLLAFISAWNEFLFALSFTQTPDKRTVNLAIFYFSGSSGNSFEIPWGQIMAATVIVTVPIVALVLIFQRRIIDGLTAGAVKG